MADRRYKLLKSGLAGDSGFSVGDLADGDLIEWDSTTGKWIVSTSLRTNSQGVTVLTGGNNPRVYLAAAGTGGLVQTDISGGFTELFSYVHGGVLRLRGEDTGGTTRTVLQGDPDAEVTLHYAGDIAMKTIAGGIQVRDNSGNDPFIEFQQDDGSTRNAFIQAHSTLGLVIRQEAHGLPITLDAEDSGGTVRTLFNADPDGKAQLYDAGTLKLSTYSGGAFVSSATAPRLYISDDGGSTNGGELIWSQGSYFGLIGREHGTAIRLWAEDSAGSTKTVFLGDPDGNAQVMYNGTSTLLTTSLGINIRPGGGVANAVRIIMEDTSGIDRAYVGFLGDDHFHIRNVVHGNEIRLETEGSDGTARIHLRCGANSTATAIGFHGTGPQAKPSVTGSRGGNAALASLLTALANYGLITDSTTA